MAIKDIKLIEKLGVATALGLAVIIVIMIWGFTDTIVGVFNSQGSDRLLSLARVGLRIYFIGFLFAGINIFCSSALSAIASVKWAFVLSILKGFKCMRRNSCTNLWNEWCLGSISFIGIYFVNCFRVCDEKINWCLGK